MGGWKLPQKGSYFALKLPQNWWLFGLDQGANSDIDSDQLEYFTNICKTQLTENDFVIVVVHGPGVYENISKISEKLCITII